MQLYRKVRAVEKIFRALDKEISKFQETASIRCIEGCGVCCTKPGIEASPLEFLPLAYALFMQSRAWEILEMLTRSDAEELCIFYDRLEAPQKPGRCLEHPRRGLICRLFGFSGAQDRNGLVHYAACRPLKEQNLTHFQEIEHKVNEGMPIPRGQYYYMMLKAVDAELMSYHPINTAIKKSLETVLSYYSYRRKRAG